MSDKPTPFADAIEQAKNLPANEGRIGVVARNGDVGAAGEVNLTFGQAWTVGATGEWMKQKGWQAAAYVGFRRTPK